MAGELEELEHAKIAGLPALVVITGAAGVVIIIWLARRSGTSTPVTRSPAVSQPGSSTQLDSTDATLLGNLSDQITALNNNLASYLTQPPINNTGSGTGSGTGTGTGTGTGSGSGTGTGTGTQTYEGMTFNQWMQYLENEIASAQPISTPPVYTPPGNNPPSNQPPVNSPPATNPTNPALQARNSIGDSKIVSYFAQFKLPSWIGLQYVAENYSLPTSIAQLDDWLDSHGYRNPQTGAFTSIVSTGTVPANVQSELNQAYGS